MSTQKAVSANPIRNAGATVLYGMATSPVTNAPGKTTVGFHHKQANLPSDSFTGLDPVHAVADGGVFANFSNSYNIYLYSLKMSDIVNPASWTTAIKGLKHPPIHFYESRYITVASGYSLTTGQPEWASGHLVQFGRDDAARAKPNNQGEFVFIPAGKMPTQAAGNHKYYTYASKTNG